jgi:hypothetical protein
LSYGGSEPEPEDGNVVDAFAARLMAGLLDLTAACGVAASMTRTADKVVLEVRLMDASRPGGNANARDSKS